MFDPDAPSLRRTTHPLLFPASSANPQPTPGGASSQEIGQLAGHLADPRPGPEEQAESAARSAALAKLLAGALKPAQQRLVAGVFDLDGTELPVRRRRSSAALTAALDQLRQAVAKDAELADLLRSDAQSVAA